VVGRNHKPKDFEKGRFFMKRPRQYRLSTARLNASRTPSFLIVLTLVMLTILPASAQTYMFNRADYATGARPQTLTVGDFNGDGITDIVVGNTHDPSSNNVSVLLGKADGTFEPAANYVAGGEPTDVAVGDFNGDGKLDIVVLFGFENASVSVLLGNGDGTFKPFVATTAGPAGGSIAVGDFDGDGKLDVAIADNESPSLGVDIVLGDGTGGFQPYKSYPTEPDARMVVVADLNGDHQLDLAVVSAAGQAISVLLGDGSGTFPTHQKLTTTATGCLSLAVGDLRHIGRLDIVAGCQPFGGVNVFLSSGGGQFGTATNYNVPAGVEDVVVGDFNGDGKLDVAVTNGGAVGMVSVLPGLGTGKFTPAVAFGTGLFPSAIGAADFNRDGKLDLVTTVSPSLSGPPTGAISVLLSNGKTLFDRRATYAVGTSSSAANSVAAADLNGDKKPDLIVSLGFENQISVLMNKGNGTFKTFVPYTDPYGPMSVVTGDFNNDHKIDVAVINANTDPLAHYTVSVFTNAGNGVLSQRTEYQVAGGAGSSFTGANAIAVGDFDKDGNLDIVTAGTSNADGNTVSVLLGTGTGFQAYLSYPTGGTTAPTGVVVGDFNNDGWLDFAVGNSADNTVSIFLNKADGTGTFTLQQPLTPTSGNPVTLAAGSFHGNGTLDLAIGLGGAFPGLGILKGNGNGTFQPVVTYSTPNNGYAVTVGDFNHDGNLDVALSLVNPGSPGFVTILPGDGHGGFSSEVNLITESLVPVNGGMHPIGIVAADFNNDGSLDVATANASTFGSSGSVSVLLNEPAIGLSATNLAFASQKVGTISAPQTVTISNPGATPTKVAITISGDFHETNNCPAKLAVGSNCTIDVTFSPTVTGIRTGTLTIKDGALSSPQKVSLTGTGI
jgi:FG-GAP-like repeat/Abnormal spindle-like microcephaly-assoc'd, ASPM-SPD-2-Hydin